MSKSRYLTRRAQIRNEQPRRRSSDSTLFLIGFILLLLLVLK